MNPTAVMIFGSPRTVRKKSANRHCCRLRPPGPGTAARAELKIGTSHSGATAVMCVGLVVLLTALVLTQGSVTLGVIVGVAGMSMVTAAVALFIGPRPHG